MIDTLADPALRGLEDRESGSKCTTPCHPGCTATCHERCRKPGAYHLHDQFYCDQIRIGRDVSEYRPDIRIAADAEKRAMRRAREEGRVRPALRRGGDGEDLFGSDFASQRMPWYERLLARLRGWDA